MQRINEMGCSIVSWLMSRLDGMGRSFDSQVESMFDALNKKIDHITKQIQDLSTKGKSEDSTLLNIHEGVANLGIVDISYRR